MSQPLSLNHNAGRSLAQRQIHIDNSSIFLTLFQAVSSETDLVVVDNKESSLVFPVRWLEQIGWLRR